MAGEDIKVPAIQVEQPAPVRTIDAAAVAALGRRFKELFDEFARERSPVERKWVRNLRQYLGIYDPEVENQLLPNASRAYPRLTRVKCISMLSRLMSLMFPGNERNWELTASPSPEMSPELVAAAVSALVERRAADGLETQITDEVIDQAVKELAQQNAQLFTELIDDQLQELGGDQTLDFIQLCRKVTLSGVQYGLGVLHGPFVREIVVKGWGQDMNGQFVPTERHVFKPQYEFLPVWDYYPDMTSKRLEGGFFLRRVMSKSELRALADRPDFFGDTVRQVITRDQSGNYEPRSFENDLRSMGVRKETPWTAHKTGVRARYEVLIWYGPVSADELKKAGVDVPEKMMADEIDAELWLVGNQIIKADINQWKRIGADVRMIHTFIFDEDDASPCGNGIPDVMRDSQMAVCATTRMALDNASVVCGPNLEVNLALMDPGQDLTSVQAWKMWYRNDSDMATAQFPAVREIKIDSHIPELTSMAKMFMDIAEMETFIGPVTGGDMSRAPSEPMRTAAGASMVRGDAALPFKDIVRNYDSFTQSVLISLVRFNEKFNPDEVPQGDYSVIARGATSLIAKEVRGLQIDTLSQTLTPDDMDHIDERKFVEAKLSSRDMDGFLVPPMVAQQRKEARQQQQAQAQDIQTRMAEAEIRDTLAGAFKSITQGTKNAAAADAQTAKAALDILERDIANDANGAGGPGASDQRAG